MSNLGIFIIGSSVTVMCVFFLVMTLHGIRHAEHLEPKSWAKKD